MASVTGIDSEVLKEDVFRASREANADRALRLTDLATPIDAIRAALTSPAQWGNATESERRRMVADEVKQRWVDDFAAVGEAVVNISPGQDFTGEELALPKPRVPFGSSYLNRILDGLAPLGILEPTGTMRGYLPVYRRQDNPLPDSLLNTETE